MVHTSSSDTACTNAYSQPSGIVNLKMAGEDGVAISFMDTDGLITKKFADFIQFKV